MFSAYRFTPDRHARRVARFGFIRFGLTTLCAIASGWMGSAAAASGSDEPAGAPPAQASAADTGPLGFLSGLSRNANMLGDMWGLRPFLGRYGMTFSLTETSELLGNATGGIKRGIAYDGLTTMTLQLDTDRAFGVYGGTFNASALQIHGRNLSSNNLFSLQTASGIEAEGATRLWELWYDQKFLAEDRLDVKVGQQSLDQEFMVSQNALLFVNTMFGWPMVPSADMPGGGPAYPLSGPGIRVRARPTDSLTFLAGVFNGSPAPSNNGDSQVLNPSGTSFPLNSGVLAIAEVQYAYPSLGTMLYANQSEPLARTYRLGIWYDSEKFADQEFDINGLSLANPGSNGIPENHHGDYAIYAVADQVVWVDPEESDRTINVFFRAMGTPLENRNLIDFSLNAGLTFKEPFLGRDDDTFGIGMGYAHVSGGAAALDRDTGVFTGSFTPIRSGETYIEATYQYQVLPWWQLQPDFQYVFNPGGGIANPNSPTEQVKNEAVFGLRTNITF
jgi:porin